MSDIAEPIQASQESFANELVWQAYSEEMAKLRQADIAEGNRLADLEELAGGADCSTNISNRFCSLTNLSLTNLSLTNLSLTNLTAPPVP